MKHSWLKKGIAALSAAVLAVELVPLQILAQGAESAEPPISPVETQEDAIEKAEILWEETELREANVKHFRLEGGLLLAASYPVPVHYQTEDGTWEEYDNTLAEEVLPASAAFAEEASPAPAAPEDAADASPLSLSADDRTEYANRQSDLPARLAKTAKKNRMFALTKDGRELSWGYLDANKSRIELTESSLPDGLTPVQTDARTTSDLSIYTWGVENHTVDVSYVTVGGGNASLKTQNAIGKINTFPTLKAGDAIVDARLNMNPVSYASGGRSDLRLALYQLEDSWTTDSLKNGESPSWTGGVQDYVISNEEGTWVITDLVKGWKDGSIPNNGFVIRSESSGMGYVNYLFSSSMEAARPHVLITYLNQKGLENHWSYHTQPAGMKGTARPSGMKMTGSRRNEPGADPRGKGGHPRPGGEVVRQL